MISIMHSITAFGVLFIIGTAGLLSTPALAAEQRCNELGANCVCSEPLNTNNLGYAGGGVYNPADSTTKQCTVELGRATGSAILRTSHPSTQPDISGTNDALILSRMPQRQSVLQYVVRGFDGLDIGDRVRVNLVAVDPERGFIDFVR